MKTKCQLATPGSERDDGEELGDGDRSLCAFTLFLFNKSETERKLEKLKKLRTVN